MLEIHPGFPSPCEMCRFPEFRRRFPEVRNLRRLRISGERRCTSSRISFIRSPPSSPSYLLRRIRTRTARASTPSAIIRKIPFKIRHFEISNRRPIIRATSVFSTRIPAFHRRVGEVVKRVLRELSRDRFSSRLFPGPPSSSCEHQFPGAGPARAGLSGRRAVSRIIGANR